MIGLSAKVERAAGALQLAWRVDLNGLQIINRGERWTGQVSVFFAQEDNTGKVIAVSEEAFEIRLTESQYKAYLQSQMPFTRRVRLKEKAATLRIVLADRATSAVGSLIVSLAEVK
jgi:hypothetical protein